MITKNYIKMCEKAPRELWDKQSKNSRIGTLMAWRSFLGIVVPCEKRKKMEGLASFIPETLVVRTWLRDDEDITILEIDVDYCSVDPDRGTPLYSQEQLQEILWEGLDEYEYWIRKLYDFILNLPFRPMSMNELWFAFVMKEKYNKIWTRKEWK